MKKLLSIMLTLCMLLTLVAVPVNVFATETEVAYEDTTLGSYYKFTFGEDEIYNYVASDTGSDASVGQATYKGNTFYPLWNTKSGGASNTAATYKAVTDVKTGEVYHTLQVTNSNTSTQTYLTPLTKDGKPFELTPGKLYQVKINVFNPAVNTWGQGFIAAAGSDSKATIKTANGLSFSDNITAMPTEKKSQNVAMPFYYGGFGTVSGGEWSVNFADGTYGKSYLPSMDSYQKQNGIAVYNRFVTTGTKKYVLVTETVDPENVPEGYILDETTKNSETPKYYRLATTGETATHRLVTSDHDKSISVYKQVSTKIGIPAEYASLNDNNGYDVVVEEGYDNNNYLTIQFGGGNANGYKTSGQYPHFVSEGADVNGVVPATYQIESIEIYEIGAGSVNFHVGDEVNTVKGVAGEEIDFYAPEAPEGKYFVNWYTDPECTKPVEALSKQIQLGAATATEYYSPLYEEGAPVDYYAKFAEYGSYINETFDYLYSEQTMQQFAEGTWTNTYNYDGDSTTGSQGKEYSYVHENVEGFKFPRYGYSFKAVYNAYPQKPTGGPTATEDDLKNHLKRVYGSDYDVTHPSGVVSTFSDRTWGMPGQISFINEDGTMFVPKPGATYNFNVKYRLLLKNSAAAGVTIQACYGYGIRYANTVSTTDTQVYLGTGKGTSKTISNQTNEWAETTLTITIPKTLPANYVPALFLSVSGVKKVPVDTDGDGTNDTYDFMVLEFDNIEVEKLNEVTFTAANGSTSTGTYLKGEAIEYPALTANYNYDYVWSLSNEKYIPAPKTAEEDITVYAYQNPVISMENMPKDDYAISDFQPSVKFVESEFVSAYKSARLYPYGVSLVTKKPNDWNEKYATARYLYNEETDAYDIPITSEMFNDAEVNGDYAKFVEKYGYPATSRGASAMEQTNIPVHKFTNYEIRPVKSKTTPTSWSTQYKNYYELVDGEYVKLSVNHTEAPTYEAGKYYIESVVNVSKKITFKYKFSGVDDSDLKVTPQIWSAGNMWWGDISFNDSAIVIESENDGWNTAVMYVHFDYEYPVVKSVGNKNVVLSLHFTPTSGKTHSFEAFIDDVVVEDYEVEEGNVVVTFMRYDAENNTFVPELGQGTPETPIDVDTHNYDPKWYNSDTRITGAEVVSTYPSKNAIYYNATYGQLNPVAGTFVTGDGWKNGGEEKEWIFENTLYDGKYALHIGGAKVAIVENDVETYMTGVNLEQGHTYKVSFKYKATAAHSKFGFTFRACEPHNYWGAGANAAKGSVSVAAGDATDGWVTKNAYFTADFSGTVTDETETGLDYNVTRENKRTLQMVFSQDANEAGNDLYFADIEVIDLGAAVVEEGGASVLKDTVATQQGQQAMRFYFNYKTDDGSNIYVGNDVLRVIERGFYYRNGAVENGGTVDTMYSTNVKQNKTDNFNTCWAYDETSKIMTFSSYITGFKLENDERKLEVKAYIIAETADGDRYTIYADSINRTVEGVKFVGDNTDDDFFAGS